MALQVGQIFLPNWSHVSILYPTQGILPLPDPASVYTREWTTTIDLSSYSQRSVLN